MDSYTYSYYMDEIDENALLEGLLGYGLFTDKIPPFLTSKPFYDWCITVKNQDAFKEEKKDNISYYKATDYIRYENIRYTNIPRYFAIPNPITYYNLCVILANNWGKLQLYFQENTKNQEHKISRLHIRSFREKYLFSMSYENFENDINPEVDFSIGSSIVVKTDISSFFHSIYTHSIPWALVGKEEAKKNKRKKRAYYNKIDSAISNTKYGETHGIHIGSHALNIISEIILVKIDKALYEKGYQYIRYIDDYICYVKSHEQAKSFLLALSTELKKYELSLNLKKTEIFELPITSNPNWKIDIHGFTFSERTRNGKVKFTEMHAYLDLVIKLVNENNNPSILTYAMKILADKNLDYRAQNYYEKYVHSLVLLYPYLIPLLEENLFIPLKTNKERINNIANDIFQLNIKNNLWEAVSYSLYFAIQYNFVLKIEEQQFLYLQAKNSDDCIFLLLAYLYEKKQKQDLSNYTELALEKNKESFDRYWLFIYEVLKETHSAELRPVFQKMQENNVSFLKKINTPLDENIPLETITL